MFGFLRNIFYTNKGCLYGKTTDQKDKFFESLAKFAITDEQFFREQYFDLLPHEEKEFSDWVHKTTEQKKQILEMVKIINKLIPNKS